MRANPVRNKQKGAKTNDRHSDLRLTIAWASESLAKVSFPEKPSAVTSARPTCAQTGRANAPQSITAQTATWTLREIMPFRPGRRRPLYRAEAWWADEFLSVRECVDHLGECVLSLPETPPRRGWNAAAQVTLEAALGETEASPKALDG